MITSIRDNPFTAFMKRRSRGKRTYLLNVIGLLCIYIVVSAVFPFIRIPFSILNENSTEAFNKMTEALSVGYLSSIILYYLSIVRRYKKERKCRIFEIYDLFNDLYDAVVYIEKEFGKGIKLFSCEDYCKYSNSTHEQFCKILSSNLGKAILYKDILTEQEQYTIFEIRKKYTGIEAYNTYMGQLEKSTNYNTLIRVCELINELRTYINLELPYKVK